MNKCVFFVGRIVDNREAERIRTKLSADGNVHEITPNIFKKRGSLAALIKQARTVHVCVDRSKVSASEINIAIAGKLSFFISDKTETGNKITHSLEEVASSNLN